MAYTNNTPQANQQISSTQGPILNNFMFLQSGLSQEHVFNSAGDGSDMTHTKASMPNMADPVTLPAGTNGMYYVNGGDASFLASDSTICKLTTGSAVTNGYQWIGRVLLQWGSITVNSNGDSPAGGQPFNIPFPNACFNVSATVTKTSENPASASLATIYIRDTGSSPSNTSFFWSLRTGSTTSNGFFWLAIGN